MTSHAQTAFSGRAIALLLTVTATATIANAATNGDYWVANPCSSQNFTFQTRYDLDQQLAPGAAIYIKTNGWIPNTGGHAHTDQAFAHPNLVVRNPGPGYSDAGALWNTDVTFPCTSGLYSLVAQVVNPNGVLTQNTYWFIVQLNRPMDFFKYDPQIRTFPDLDDAHPGAIYLRREVISQADSLLFNIKEAYSDATINLTHVGLEEGGTFDWNRGWHDVHAGHWNGLGFDARIQFNGPPEVLHSHIDEAGCTGYSMGQNEWHIECPGEFRISQPAGHGH